MVQYQVSKCEVALVSTMSLNTLLLRLLLVSLFLAADAFITTSSDKIKKTCNINNSPVLVLRHRQGLFARDIGADDISSKEYWLDEFKAPSGEILNPYKVLKLKRDATILQIKNAYREQSRRYHPDTQRFKDMLPGSW
jgi:DnaJ domain